MDDLQQKSLSNVRLVCPICHHVLESKPDGWFCTNCERLFENTAHGYTNLLVVPPFTDEEDVERGYREERMAEVLMGDYLGPLLKKLFGDVAPSQVAVLDLGCGVGKLVDLLCGRGYDAWGIDNGLRIDHWHRHGRKYPARLIMAGGEAMPFPNESFDLIFSSGVIEHIGCIGDARAVSPGYQKARLQFTRESVRVTKSGGYINYTCPNRLFPFDLFHRNKESNPFRFHWPWDPFPLSKSDLYRLFVKQCGCRSIRALPVKGYWECNRLKSSYIGKVGCQAADLWFNTMGSWPWFRGSFLNPWLSILAQKGS